MMSLSHEEQGMQCVIHWFTYWSELQKSDFLKDLVTKAVPLQSYALLDAMSSLSVTTKRLPSIFDCQLKLFDQWFGEWTEKERNMLMQRLEQVDPAFVAKFNEEVATASCQS